MNQQIELEVETPENILLKVLMLEVLRNALVDRSKRKFLEILLMKYSNVITLLKHL